MVAFVFYCSASAVSRANCVTRQVGHTAIRLVKGEKFIVDA